MLYEKHYESLTPLYEVWKCMKRRCYNKNSTGFKYWGGRGITVCDEWQEYIPFRNWARANGYKRGLTLEREDNNKGYNPNNCSWVTHAAQHRNRSDNKLITLFGETKLQEDWFNDPRCLTKKSTFFSRLKIG